jgi:outer membrane lipoprotein-sorting protein
LSFLLGLGNLKRDFKASLKGSDNNQYTLQLEAKSEMGQVGAFFLGVDAKNSDSDWVRLIDPVGNVTAVRFSQMQRGVGLKDSLFQFEAPKGAEIVDMSRQKGP